MAAADGAEAGVEFGLLGQLAVRLAGRRVDIRGRRQRMVLGLLLLDAGHVVSRERLLTSLWGDGDLPRTAHNSLQVSISTLRAVLGSAAPILNQDEGYRIEVPPEAVDVFRFRALVASAAAAGPADALAALRKAEALWRGPVLDGVFDDRLRGGRCVALEEERVAATEQRMALELGAGRHGAVVGELLGLTESHPYRERLTELLMLALYRSGQAARALEVFRAFKTRLAGELGMDPGPGLLATELAILRRSPEIDRPAQTSDRRHEAPPNVYQQLPPDLPGFIGRATELRAITEAAAQRSRATVRRRRRGDPLAGR